MYTYKHAITIREEKAMNLKDSGEWVCICKDFRKERERENDVIKLQSQKQNKNKNHSG